ncbi:MAG: hypothetical protein WC433_02000 [Candidatus Omnitrophota bacterium]
MKKEHDKKDKQLNIRLSVKELENLKRIAKENGVSVSSAVLESVKTKGVNNVRVS